MGETVSEFLSVETKDLLQSMPDSASLHDANGNAIWVSDKTLEMFCKGAENLNNKGFIEQINPQDKLDVLKAFSDCNASGKQQTVTFRCQFIKPDGSFEVSYFELRVSSYLHKEEQFFLALVRDISNDKRSSDQAKQDVERAQNSSSTKSMFLSHMSHELRTPLNAIIGFSQMLMGEAAVVISDEKKTEYAGLVNQSASHLLNIINDPRAIQQVLINLIANAIKFSNRGDKVTVVIERNRRKVNLKVIDTGLGMEKDTLDNLGSSFFQEEQSTTKRFEGTGLGLSIVFGLVQLHNGEISFDSTKGSGTTVVFGLGFALIAGNALYSQEGSHPDPIWSTAKQQDSLSQNFEPEIAKVSKPNTITRSVLTQRISVTNIPVPTASPARSSSIAAQSSLVRDVQSALADIGFYKGKIDGIYGAGTKLAIMNFQQRAGIIPNGEASYGLLSNVKSVQAVADVKILVMRVLALMASWAIKPKVRLSAFKNALS